MMKVWWKDLIIRQNSSSEINSEFDKSNAEVIEKKQYDAFYETELNEILIKNNIDTILICGVMTNLCCETTARSGFVNGYKVFFLVDGTATYNYDFHLASVLNLSFGFACPVLCEEILSKLNEE
jgi:nicotinamidase-related amidase